MCSSKTARFAIHRNVRHVASRGGGLVRTAAKGSRPRAANPTRLGSHRKRGGCSTWHADTLVPTAFSGSPAGSPENSRGGQGECEGDVASGRHIDMDQPLSQTEWAIRQVRAAQQGRHARKGRSWRGASEVWMQGEGAPPGRKKKA